MPRRSSRRRKPSGRGRRWNPYQYGVILMVCLLGALVLLLIVIMFQGLSLTQLPRGLK